MLQHHPGRGRGHAAAREPHTRRHCSLRGHATVGAHLRHRSTALLDALRWPGVLCLTKRRRLRLCPSLLHLLLLLVVRWLHLLRRNRHRPRLRMLPHLLVLVLHLVLMLCCRHCCC